MCLTSFGIDAVRTCDVTISVAGSLSTVAVCKLTRLLYGFLQNLQARLFLLS